MPQLITTDLPADLAGEAQKAWRRIQDVAEPEALAALSTQLNEDFSREFARVLACSPFVFDLCRRRLDILLALLRADALNNSLDESAFKQGLETLLAVEGAQLAPTLRYFRAYHMLRIVWRDFCRSADTLETVRDTSALADACIAYALSYTQTELEARHGQPIGKETGSCQQLIVLAMGKLGARELNVSSDIDLIFVFSEGGETNSDSKPISNEQFFTKVGQGVIAALEQNTVDGFVFRVDMRLRPYGESGALVHSFAALESYYQDQGRDWERYALIKARPVTGDASQADRLMDALRPFIFRRYIDFGVIDSLRSMKQMIAAEVRRRGLQQDVKLGHGGIREVEFIAQCFQLIRGGRDLGLQQRELLAVLEECAVLGCLPRDAVAELRQAYLFLRDSEHAIQGYRDRQSQVLPSDLIHQSAMATIMGYGSWDEYLVALDVHRSNVASHFIALIADPVEHEENAEDELFWGQELSADYLRDIGFNEAQDLLQRLQALQSGPRIMALQSEGKKRLEEFMPQLLRACAKAQSPDVSLQRVLPLVEAVLRRSAYLALLVENPTALKELVVLCGASPWIAEQLAQHPVLLDELLDRTSLYSAIDKSQMRDQLRQQVARLAESDLEAQMDALRYFKASHVLRVAASEIQGQLPLMQVSDRLTWIAEVILEQVLLAAWANMTAKFGAPSRESTGVGFAVFGYGKLGGIELGYGSDLDLVFVFDAARQGVTQGQRSIDNTVFYTRLGQRMIHILETRMAMGQLYEIDMRLRPSGNSGMLVTTISSFDIYQKESAWTWEHQALVRARFVAGDPVVAEQVESIRKDVLCLRRDADELALDVGQMRDKMRKHLLADERPENREFHLKQGVGGIVDIEFMVQYAVLAWSHHVPALTRWSDNVRIIETLGREKLFEQEMCDTLTDAYLAYRCAAHQLSLQQQPDTVAAERFATFSEAVRKAWEQVFCR